MSRAAPGQGTQPLSPRPTIKVELHCHTRYSHDCLMEPRRLLEICRQRGIQRLAITDHNRIEGALEAAKLDPERVIIGEEIKTQEGELLGYFLTECVPPGLPAIETIERLRAQNAVIAIAHPYDGMRSGAWREQDLARVLPLVDTIEVFNARCWSPRANHRAAEAARRAGLPGIAGSDAHAYLEVGRGLTLLPQFTDRESFLAALPQAQIQARSSPLWVHLLSRYASWRKRLPRLRGRPGT